MPGFRGSQTVQTTQSPVRRRSDTACTFRRTCACICACVHNADARAHASQMRLLSEQGKHVYDFTRLMLSVLKTTTPLANPVAKTPIQILLDLRPVRQTTASRRRHQIVQPASLHPGSGKPVHSTARARPPFPSELENVPALSGTPRGGPPRARRSSSSRRWSSWARSRTCRRRRRELIRRGCTEFQKISI